MEPQKKTDRAELGQKIAILRTRRKWSRARMIRRLYDELETRGDEDFYIYSEAWLKRVENGGVVKLSRTVLEAIMNVLDCTPAEQVDLLLTADRSIFPREDNQQHSAAIVLARATFHLVNDETVQRFITDILLRNKLEAAKLTDHELLLVLGEVINIALKAQNRDDTNLEEQEPRASSLKARVAKE